MKVFKMMTRINEPLLDANIVVCRAHTKQPQLLLFCRDCIPLPNYLMVQCRYVTQHHEMIRFAHLGKVLKKSFFIIVMYFVKIDQVRSVKLIVGE
jgi:hypothetical protein